MTKGPRTPGGARVSLLAVSAALALLAAAGCSSDDGGPDGAAERSGAPDPSAGSGPPRTGEASRGPSPVPAEGEVEVVDTLARGLDSPWGLALLPGGEVLVGSRDEARVLEVAGGSGEVTEAGAVPQALAGQGEGGLLGLAPHPDFAANHRLFVYCTTASDNRVLSFVYDASAPEGERLGPPEEVLTGIPRGEVVHNGGGLAFGPDGMLYAATGDTGEAALAQDQESLAGKILRLDPETGEPPADNPDPGSYVWSLGHRNVQGLAWDAEGNMWASEFGNDTWDELNRIVPGGNYGWPEVEGTGGEDRGFTDPVARWRPADASPSGLAYSQGSLWLAGLRGERLWRVPLDGTEPAAEPQAFLDGEWGRLRSVLATGEGKLLLATNETDTRGTPEGEDDRLLRLRVS